LDTARGPDTERKQLSKASVLARRKASCEDARATSGTALNTEQK
jgi:hypothetical protein